MIENDEAIELNEEELERANGGFGKGDVLRHRIIAYKTHEIVGDIISHKDATILSSFIMHDDIKAAYNFARDKYQSYGPSTIERKKFRELAEYYASIMDKF